MVNLCRSFPPLRTSYKCYMLPNDAIICVPRSTICIDRFAAVNYNLHVLSFVVVFVIENEVYMRGYFGFIIDMFLNFPTVF